MTYDDIFEAYYSLYRAEADTPISTDDEYVVGLRLANEALSRWENYDNTMWKPLYETNQVDGSGDQVIVTGQTDYDGPDNMKSAGGSVFVKNSSGDQVREYKLVEPEQVQFQGDNSQYAYFTGTTGDFTLHLNPAPDATINGMDIDYMYYKSASKYSSGTSVSEIPNPYFIVHRMLGNRYRASRNPYYGSALSDAEEALKIMQLENNSGTWSNPWKLADNSGSEWGN